MPEIDTVRAVRQAAETSRLLGVDFIPVFRTGESVLMEPKANMPKNANPGGKPGPTREVEADERPPKIDAAPPSTHRDRAEAERRMAELRERYERDAPHQHFVTDFQNIVFGDGDVCARLMFVGEAPGAEEDKQGIPFVGKAGQLLEKMINAMGLERREVYITNVLKTRPPNNATPTSEEARLCAPYLFEQIRIIQPEVIVTVGLPASKVVLDTNESMGRLRGRWAELRLDGDLATGAPELVVPVMPTYHPAFLLRSYTPENRAKVWSDLRLVMERLGLEPPAKRPAQES